MYYRSIIAILQHCILKQNFVLHEVYYRCYLWVNWVNCKHEIQGKHKQKINNKYSTCMSSGHPKLPPHTHKLLKIT